MAPPLLRTLWLPSLALAGLLAPLAGAQATATPGGVAKQPSPIVSPFEPVPGGGGQAYVPPDQGTPPTGGSGGGSGAPGGDGGSAAPKGAPPRSGPRAVGGAVLPGSRASASGGSASTLTSQVERDTWLVWWETNKFDFIRLRRIEDAPYTGQGRLQETEQQKAERLAAVRTLLRDQVLPALAGLTTAQDPAVRAAAVVALGKLRAEEGVVQARQLLRDRSFEVRRAAMLSLGVLEGGMPAWLLMNIAEDSPRGRELLDTTRISPEDRGVALLAASLRGGADPALLLSRLLRDPSTLPNEVVASACQAAGLSAASEAIQPLTAIARSRDWPEFVRSAATSALGHMGEPAVVPILLSLMDEGLEPRRAAAVALGYAAEPGMASVVQRLELALLDSDAPTRHFAAVSLGRLGGPAARAALLAAFRDPPPDMRPWLALGLGLVERSAPMGGVKELLQERLAQESNAEQRGAYLVALGLCGGADVLPTLARELQGSQVAVASQAALALGLTEAPDALPLLLGALASARAPAIQSHVALGLGVLGNSAATAPLLELIRSTADPYVASFAAIGIAFMGDENAVGPLLRIIEKGGARGVQTTYAVAAVGQLFDSDRRPALSRLASGDNHLARSSSASQLLALGF